MADQPPISTQDDRPPQDVPGSDSPLREVTLMSAWLGVIAFGGPAAHVALLRREVVDERRWITPQHFLDLLGVTNLIPGPNSTEMVMHVGRDHAGWRGLVAAGTAFILPAATITLALAVAYERYGSTPTGESLLYGIKPVIIAVVGQAIWRLGRTAWKRPFDLVAMIAVALLFIAGISELVLLFAGGLLIAGITWAVGNRGRPALAVAPWQLLIALPGAVATGAEPYSAARLFFAFLRIGAVLYGSGYVLLAFLRNTFVVDYGWITDQQLIDAVAVGQMTPGPVFTTATFVGYLVGGFPGAVLATLGIFLPAFIFVAAVGPRVAWLRSRASLALLLDGVNIAAIGLMAGVTWFLGRDALVDPLTVTLATVALVLLVWRDVNSVWLIALGALVGLAQAAL